MKLKKILKEVICFSLILFVVFSCETDESDEECEHKPSNCREYSYTEGTIVIDVTIDNENPSVLIELYRGNVEDNVLIDSITTTESSYSATLPISDYSGKVQYVYSGATIIAIDGDSIESVAENYCEGTCYSLKNAHLNLILDKEAFNEQQSGEDEKCFIATAAYGSAAAEEVKILRKFRNDYLLTNLTGRKFVKLYYEYSPSIAVIIKKSEILKRIIRICLSFFIFIIKYPLTFIFFAAGFLWFLIIMHKRFCNINYSIS